jgi:hypothetical protein
MWDYGRVMSNRLADLGPVSQNYWFKSILLWSPNDPNTTPTTDQREDQRLPIFHRMER